MTVPDDSNLQQSLNNHPGPDGAGSEVKANHRSEPQASEKDPGSKPLLNSRLPAVSLLVVCAAVITAGVCFWALSDKESPPRMTEMPEIPATDLTLVSDKARSVIEKAQQRVKDRPRSSESWGQLGLVLLAHQFDRDARLCFQQAARLGPEEFRWHYYCGLASAAENRPFAIASFRRACELRPDESIAHARLGELLLASDAIEAAEDHLQRAAVLSKVPSPRTLQALARVKLLRKRLPEAQSLIEQALQQEPESRMLLEVLARIQQKQGNRDAARTTIQFMQQLPDFPLPWYDPWAAAALRLQADSDKTQSDIRQLIERDNLVAATARLQQVLSDSDDASPAMWLQLADLLRQSDRREEALELLREFRNRFPDHTRGLMRLGVLQAEQGDWESAVEAFSRVTEIMPDNFQAFFNLAQCRLRTGEVSLAGTALRNALAIIPESCEARLLMVRVCLQVGDCSEALQHLKLASRSCMDAEKFRNLSDEVERACQ